MQEVLEKAISAVTQEEIQMIGAGRTDAGAHALQQVVAFSTESKLAPDVLLRAVNAHLPDDIAVTDAAEVPADFHPRFDARSRTYQYLIWNRAVRAPFWLGRAAHVKQRLDDVRMNEAAGHLIGTHDFSAFVATPVEGSRERAMLRSEVQREGDLVTITLEATGFMRQMARAIAGTLILVGLGKLSGADFERILQSRDRSLAADTAPAEGLYLVRVNYDEPAEIGETETSIVNILEQS